MSKLLATTALGLVLGLGTAMAETQTPVDDSANPPAAMPGKALPEQPADAPAMKIDPAGPSEAAPGRSSEAPQAMPSDALPSKTANMQFLNKQEPHDWLASNLIGKTVVNANNESIGEINDLVFGNDGKAVVDTGKLTGIDNLVDQTTGTVKIKGEFPNVNYQLWPGQFVNVRLKVETLDNATVIPTAAVQRGPAGTFSYVIGSDNTVNARPVTVVQQNETDAVISKGLDVEDRVVTTGFANLAEGARVTIGSNDNQPVAPDLAPRRRGQGQKGQGQGQGGGRRNGNAGQTGQGAAKGQPPQGAQAPAQ